MVSYEIIAKITKKDIIYCHFLLKICDEALYFVEICVILHFKCEI